MNMELAAHDDEQQFVGRKIGKTNSRLNKLQNLMHIGMKGLKVTPEILIKG